MHLKPANILRRSFAGFIDYFFISGISYAYIINYGSLNSEGNYSVSGIKALIPVAVWLIFTVVMEQLAGATIGNGIVSLKPLDVSKLQKLSWSQSLKRHLLDLIDMSFFGLVAIIAIKNSPNRQRLGDLWAKTIVVQDRR